MISLNILKTCLPLYQGRLNTLESESLFYVGTRLSGTLGATIAAICVRKMANVE